MAGKFLEQIMAENDLGMDANNLYREEVYSDRRAGTIRVLTPVTREGLTDMTRKAAFVGEAQILTPVGALPIVFEIEAASVGEAADKFAEGAKAAVARTMEELQRMRREQASGLVIADSLPGGMPGAPGGGKIQLR